MAIVLKVTPAAAETIRELPKTDQRKIVAVARFFCRQKSIAAVYEYFQKKAVPLEIYSAKYFKIRAGRFRIMFKIDGDILWMCAIRQDKK